MQNLIYGGICMEEKKSSGCVQCALCSVHPNNILNKCKATIHWLTERLLTLNSRHWFILHFNCTVLYIVFCGGCSATWPSYLANENEVCHFQCDALHANRHSHSMICNQIKLKVNHLLSDANRHAYSTSLSSPSPLSIFSSILFENTVDGCIGISYDNLKPIQPVVHSVCVPILTSIFMHHC